MLSITGNEKLGLEEVSAAASIIYEKAHEDANIILGSVIDNTLDDEIIITVVATGFGATAQQQKQIEASQIATKPAFKEKAEEQVTQAKETTMFDDMDIPAALRRAQSIQRD